MFSGTTQEDWQRELEKVSMKLKLEYGKINANGSSEWREHIQQIKQGGDKFNTAIEKLKSKINYTDIVFNMMPEYFALGDLQQVYEVILHKKLLDPAFRRIIADKVEKTEFVKTGGGHRPSVLFRYKKNK